MEQFRVVIVGAGPAGLVTGLALARNSIKSTILERENEITQDPRGVYLAGDAVRILASLGLADDLAVIGHELQAIEFHSSSFNSKPFYSVDLRRDALQQALPSGIVQMQPELGTFGETLHFFSVLIVHGDSEKAIHRQVKASGLCEIRTGCDVQVIRQCGEDTEIEYTSSDGSAKSLRTHWLIGADGKRGTVRKKFLESEAGICQVLSDYQYQGAWVAANLKMTLPTPETHPKFGAWRAGLTPEEVYDLFWPPKWHFCCPPGKPTACGRFGPIEERLWRHEFRQESFDEKSMDSEELMWDHLTPMITRTADLKGKPFGEPITFPADCIQVLRCRQFTFAHKVVNRWFHKQTVLIGDAAHVFPPFGGQGIASGIRDAHQLAWRIALLEKHSGKTSAMTSKVLDAWAAERTWSVKSAASLTKLNGMLCNEPVTLLFWLVAWLRWAMRYITGSQAVDSQSSSEQAGFQKVSGGFILPAHGGGKRLPQIYVDSVNERIVPSDDMFKHISTPFRILALVRGNETPGLSRQRLQAMLEEYQIPATVLSCDSLVYMSASPCAPKCIGSFSAPSSRKFAPTPLSRLPAKCLRPGYDCSAFVERLGQDTKYAIVRPDFFVFATAKDLADLRACLKGLDEMLFN